MHTPQDGTPGPGSDGRGEPPMGVQGCLVLGMALLAIHLLPLGLMGVFAALRLAALGPEPWWSLLLLAWAFTPVLCGLLLFRAAFRLGRPGVDASASLVMAAAAAFVGLAWVAVTVALMLGVGR
jgi:hypothetical protein